MKKDDELELIFQAISEIAVIGRLADTALGHALPPELSVAGFGVLNYFVRLGKESESPARLARAFRVTKGAMTNTLQRLEALGYVKVEGDPDDARAKLVRPTKAGKAARNEGVARIEPGLMSLRSAIPASDFAAVLPLLVRLRGLLDGTQD